MKRCKYLLLLAFFTVFFMTACSSSKQVLVEEPALAKKGLEVFGRGVPYMVVRIPDVVEQNPLRQEQHDEKVIKRLTALFNRGAKDTVQLVLGGPSSPRTREIAILAIQKAPSKSLGG